MTERKIEWTPRESKRLLEGLTKRWADVLMANVNHIHPQMATSLDSRIGHSYVTMLGTDHLHGRQLRERERERETNKDHAGARTTGENGPSK
ncbi:hypothetical protein KIN20_004092 [Parelaphostrongylus tenuis]|uniref:Uncharacterized protein n=1 Tax=Parelaphostrongylus tenuis TaxID=148309 RepID=A0AAD5MGJ0_PARTN|nr:hypothetical protein KIN20_004092 [Parelaphostrongylus tenuis]